MSKPERPTVKHHDLTRLTGYSQSTISRALDPEKCHLVKPEVVAAIREVAKSLGYKNNVSARRLRSGLTRTISLVMPDSVYAPPAWPSFELGGHLLAWLEVKGTIEAAEHLGFDVKLIMPTGGADGDGTLADRVGFPHADGVILSGTGNARQHLAAIQQAGIPYVTTGAFADERLAPRVHLEQAPGIHEAVAHLHASGRRTIVYATFDPAFATSEWGLFRIDAYRTAVAAAGGRERIVVATSPLRIAEDVLAHLPRDGSGAVLCVNDSLARLVVQEALRLGLRVPQDLAVVGFDDNPIFHREEPRLSTIRMQHATMGTMAATSLIAAIRTGEAIPAKTAIASTFVANGTT